MNSTHWERIQALFHDAADQPKCEQRAFVEAACGDDQQLKADVLALLVEDARGASLLDRDVAHVANEMLGTPVPSSAFSDQFGRYRIRQSLGAGGMGVVYLAEREDLGSLVAIKILRDAWMSPARRQRFAVEQRTLAQLNHPCIARLYDADTLPDGTPWFVMEYVEGVPITGYCHEHRCSIEERLGLFRSVCEAVQHAHEHAVIHRDLKPSNILVKAGGNVRLLDFGIAKQLDHLDQPVDQTRTELRLMTPAYAAPEQIRGEQVGIFTDVYALGVILYELLAGRPPFDLSNRTPGEAERIIFEQQPEKPSLAGQRILPARKSSWADLDVLCLTAMHKDVSRRYRSVEALTRDIDHYLKGEPLEARRDTLRYRLGKFARRNRRAVAAAALVFTAVLALVVFFTVRLTSARNAALAEAARTQRVQGFMLNLFEGGDKEAGPADSLRVVTLIDRGVREAQSLNRDPAVQAELYQTLGSIYEKLGNLTQADSLLRSSLEQRKSLYGPDHPEVAESLVTLGLLRVDQARLEEGEQLIREGLEKTRRMRPVNKAAVARATTALGRVLEARGAYEQAIPVLEEAVKLQSMPGPATPELAASLNKLANAHFYTGHYDISDSLNRRVLSITRHLFGERHPLVADDLMNLGAIQFQRGHYGEAERLYRQALEITQGWYGKDHPETASNLTLLGQALSFQTRYDEAARLLQQALEISERVYGREHPRVAFALNELALVWFKRGNLDDAEEGFRRTAHIYQVVYGDRDHRTATALANVASIYLQRKQYARAEQMYRKVVELYTNSLSADHMSTGIAQIKLGRALVGQKHYREAEGYTLSGYRILMKQTSPSVSWLRGAREDLIAIYSALKQPAKAKEFRAELVASRK